VKYAECVIIWPFNVLVLFLKPCVQFLKPCVQFLMNTILNLAIIQFLMKKGRCVLIRRVSHPTKREIRYIYVHLTSKAKGEARYGGTSPFYLIAQKRLPIEYSPWDNSLRPHVRAHLSTCAVCQMYPNGHACAGARSTE
jgi:hypothetical protein